MRVRLTPLALVGLLVAAAPIAPAAAHTMLNTPPPRDVGKAGADAHKNGPCGGLARTGKPTVYAVGQTVQVEFTETIDHRGCFQVLFSEANDQNFQILAQVNDPAGTVVPSKRTLSATLPAGKSCTSCTLAVRQLMIGQACVTNQKSLAAGDTYFTCADICVGTECADAGAPPAPDASAPPPVEPPPAPDGGAGPAPSSPAPSSDGGGSGDGEGTPRTLLPPDDSGGCSAAALPVHGFGWLAGAGLAVAIAGLARRRVRRSPQR